MRVFHTVAHTCPSGEVEHGVKRPEFLEKFFQGFVLLDVKFVEAKLFSMFMSLELTQSPILESNIIIIVEVIDSDHSMPMVEQFLADLGGDEPSDSGNEIFFTQA